MDRGPNFDVQVVWVFTWGPPNPKVMEMFRSLLEAGSTGWVIVPLPVEKGPRTS